MQALVTEVKATVKIKLNNAGRTEIVLPFDTFGTPSNTDNYITLIKPKGDLSSSNKNPIGVVSSNTMHIELVSNDKKLMPENDSSPYYGYMDDTAIITVTVEESGETIGFGKYYVSKWTSTVTANSPNRVVIEASDIISIIGKHEVPSVDIVGNILTKEYLIAVIDKLNALNDADHQIEYDSADIDFSEFPYMQYNGLDTGTMSDCLNTISQSTMTNIYIDRTDNKLKTDYCGDDTAAESICTLSDSINIISPQVKNGALIGYSGVRVNYAIGTVNPSSKVGELSKQAIVTGVNTFSNIKLGSGVHKVNFVKITTQDSVAVYVSNLTYNRNVLNLEITSAGNTTCNIEIYGQSVNLPKLYIDKYRAVKTNSSLLEINNSMLPKEYINKYADEIVALMDLKSGELIITGWINPRLKLSNIVYIEATSIETSGYYKILTEEWAISSTIKASLRVMSVSLAV